MHHHLLSLSTAFGLAALLAGPVVAAPSDYKLVKTIDLPGSKGGHGDWTTFDPATQTVWLSQSPDHNVVVINAQSMAIEHVFPGIKDGNGIALTPAYAFLVDNGTGIVTVVDKKSFNKVATLTPDGKEPDGAVFDTKNDTVLITSNSDHATFFSGQKPFKKLSSFTLKPYPAKDGPDVGLYVPSLNKVYQPVDNVVDVIDPDTRSISAVWDLGVKGSTKPLVYDEKTNHLFLGTTDKKVLVLDAGSGKVVASIPVAGSMDETVIDEGARRAFVGDKAGMIEVIDLDHDKVVATIPSEKNVHTLAVDTTSHRVFVYRNESNKVDVYEPAAGS